MAIVIRGATSCAICRKILQSNDEVIAFPAAFPNEASPLFLFHDTAVHVACFCDHPLRQAVEERLADFRQRTGPGKRFCRVCGLEVLTPDEHLGLGHLTDDPTSSLHQYNYAHFHRTCFKEWPDSYQILTLLEAMVTAGTWRGVGSMFMIKDLKNLLFNKIKMATPDNSK